MHSPLARALFRPRPLLHCPRALIKPRNAHTTGIYTLHKRMSHTYINYMQLVPIQFLFGFIVSQQSAIYVSMYCTW